MILRFSLFLCPGLGATYFTTLTCVPVLPTHGGRELSDLSLPILLPLLDKVYEGTESTQADATERAHPMLSAVSKVQSSGCVVYQGKERWRAREGERWVVAIQAPFFVKCCTCTMQLHLNRCASAKGLRNRLAL